MRLAQFTLETAASHPTPGDTLSTATDELALPIYLYTINTLT